MVCAFAVLGEKRRSYRMPKIHRRQMAGESRYRSRERRQDRIRMTQLQFGGSLQTFAQMYGQSQLLYQF